MTSSLRLGAIAGLSERVPDLLVAAAPKVVVIGDLILDGWWHGEVQRMCREAPAPVVELRSRQDAAGGAANTAVNAARLGAQVAVVSVVGDDSAGRRLRDLLVESGVDCDELGVRVGAATTTKSRIVAGDQILARLDEPCSPPPRAALSALARGLPGALDGADAVLVCDYGLGVLKGEVRRALVRLLGDPARQGGRRPLLVVDAHDPARWRSLHPDVSTPNAAEALAMLGTAPGGDRVQAIRSRRRRLLERTGARCVVVTLDRDGTLALPGPDYTLGTVQATGSPAPTPISEHRTWARPAGERQASGAGDTFVACLTVGLAAGLDAPVALNLAQAAADVVVHLPGTSVCATADLQRHLGGLAAMITDLDQLTSRLDADRRAGRRIVLTNGCFDVLHRGHTRSLEQARQLGDVLVVGLNDDASVRRLKGPDRPIIPAADRAAVLAALSCVDHVVTFGSDTAVPLIERLRPDVYAKGGDYTTGSLPEAAAVEAYGGAVVILDFVPDRSTSAVLRRIRATRAPGGVAQPERRPA